ncbi:MAG: ABC transporter permease [Blastochloris viridis]|uniref:ABC transporter permease n=1 Tax=Blastochloris viridis TaxID=1079 RepID=A0A6N4R6V5_BLAVI|nr:MAG: ABC transporter permease [Blastochloris viridis]
MRIQLPSFSNIVNLCRKEWLSLMHDTVMLVFIVFSFSLSLYSQATGTSTDLNQAAVGIVDEDRSQLSSRFTDALLPPYFGKITHINQAQVDKGLESATYSFVVHFPEKMEADLRAGKTTTVQILIDATVIGQAQIGAGYIQNIFQQELARYFNIQSNAKPQADLVIRYAFNQARNTAWFSSITGMIQNVTMLAILLAGAALLRERESGTIEHLLVMPVTAVEIVLSKVIANGAVILLVVWLAIELTIRRWIGVEINGSVPLFMLATALYLFFTTGLGLFLGTVARSMPQLGLMFILIVLPMNLLSGGFTPLESMPAVLQSIMKLVPSTNYISLAQAILFRNAGLSVVWPQMLMVTGVGLLLFVYSILKFRSFLGRQG